MPLCKLWSSYLHFLRKGKWYLGLLFCATIKTPIPEMRISFCQDKNVILTLLKVPSCLLISYVLPFLFAFMQHSVLPHCSPFKHFFLGLLKTLPTFEQNCLHTCISMLESRLSFEYKTYSAPFTRMGVGDIDDLAQAVVSILLVEVLL